MDSSNSEAVSLTIEKELIAKLRKEAERQNIPYSVFIGNLLVLGSNKRTKREQLILFLESKLLNRGIFSFKKIGSSSFFFQDKRDIVFVFIGEDAMHYTLDGLEGVIPITGTIPLIDIDEDAMDSYYLQPILHLF